MGMRRIRCARCCSVQPLCDEWLGNGSAKGLKEMYDMGARTVGQDEDSCMVHGMSKEAVKLSVVNRELPLECIAYEIVTYGGGR